MIVLGGATLFGLLLILNGIYIILAGRIGPNWGKLPETGNLLSRSQRLSAASLYIVFGTAILIVLFATQSRL
jgi:hypothetical protein